MNRILGSKEIWIDPTNARVDTDRCRWCGKCADACEFGAIEIVQTNGVRAAKVNDVLCRGCGACVVVCPTNAMDIAEYSNDQVDAVLDAAARWS